jgi:two-component system sensor histidine kinase RegB
MNFDEKTKGYLTHDNLKLLFRLRNIAVAAQSAAILLAVVYLDMVLPLAAMSSVIAVLSGFNIYTRLRINNRKPVTVTELIIQLVVDILALTVLLSLSGGASNPFAILYLLPLTITAILLPARATWGLAGLTVVCYSSLLVVYVPMPHAHHEMNQFNLHIVGMWLGFVLSAGVIAYFIVGLQKIIKKQARALNKAREDAIRNEQLVKLGVLATSVAHDLGTPMNSMSLMLEDIEFEEAKSQPELLDKTRIMREQIERCRTALTTLKQSAGSVSLRGGQQILLCDYLNDLLNNWQRSHPDTEVSYATRDCDAAIMIDEVLNMALTNILDNAAEVSPDHIEINSSVDQEQWDLTIRDFGPGLTADDQKSIGKQGYSTKSHGLGLGLFLSHSIIERLGGAVQLYNHETGGLCTHVRLPLQFKTVNP